MKTYSKIREGPNLGHEGLGTGQLAGDLGPNRVSGMVGVVGLDLLVGCSDEPRRLACRGQYQLGGDM